MADSDHQGIAVGGTTLDIWDGVLLRKKWLRMKRGTDIEARKPVANFCQLSFELRMRSEII
jgi:hypothetical protein